jgi:hypothetical protein
MEGMLSRVARYNSQLQQELARWGSQHRGSGDAPLYTSPQQPPPQAGGGKQRKGAPHRPRQRDTHCTPDQRSTREETLPSVVGVAPPSAADSHSSDRRRGATPPHSTSHLPLRQHIKPPRRNSRSVQPDAAHTVRIGSTHVRNYAVKD